jgi:hypothetical protein
MMRRDKMAYLQSLKIEIDDWFIDPRMTKCFNKKCIHNYEYKCKMKEIEIKENGVCSKYREK